MLLAASTPNRNLAHDQTSHQADYLEIIPGIQEQSFSPTLSALNTEPSIMTTNDQSLSTKVTKGLNKYLQEAEQLQEIEDNYFEVVKQSTNTSPTLEVDHDQTMQKDLDLIKNQLFYTDETESYIPKSLDVDTSHLLQPKQQPVNTTQADIHLDIDTSEDQLQIKDPQDFPEDDTLLPNSDASPEQSYNTAKDASLDLSMMQENKLPTETEHMDPVNPAMSKVGCIELTNHLQKYLQEYLQLSNRQAFLNIHHMLALLDQYLYDNLVQHIQCMPHNSEYLTLLIYAMHFKLDISTFPTIWAVLSINLDTQDGTLDYVKFLQEQYNRYYKLKTREYMEELEQQSTEMQTVMYDTITPNFNRVSGLDNNGTTPPQGQQDEQLETVNADNEAIDSDENDILTDYPHWSSETHDKYDLAEDI